MQVTINFPNENVAQKILWLLEHFKSEGVEIIKHDDNHQILDNFKEGLDEIKLIQKGELKAKSIEELLSEL